MMKNLFIYVLLLLLVLGILYKPLESPSIIHEESTYLLQTAQGSYLFQLKIADTLEKHSTGLMHIKSMPTDCGMIFINSTPIISRFWMKNTHIPLDIIFLDEEYRAIYIHKDAQPHDETHISPLIPAKYTIEINAGIADATGLSIGSTFTPHG